MKSRFKLSRSSRARAREATTTASNALVTALTIVKEALDGLPIPGLKAAVGGVLEVIRTIDKMKGNARDIEELRNHVERLNNSIIHRLSNARMTDALESRIDSLAVELEWITADYDKMAAKNCFLRFFSVHEHANTIVGLNRMLDRAIQTFLAEAVIEIEQRVVAVDRRTTEVQQQVTRTHHTVQRIEQQTHHIAARSEETTQLICDVTSNTNVRVSEIQINQVEQDLLNRLPNADARYDSASRSTAPSCLENTRVSLLEEISKWIDGLGAEKVYWLHGLAGTGKSTIAHTVAERLAKKEQLGASFFFSRDTGDRRDPLRVLPALAHQLAEFSPKFKKSLLRSLEMRKDAGTANLTVQMEKLLAWPLRDMELPGESSPVIVVLDALDECENQQLVSILLKLAFQFLLDTPNMDFKLFITSRPEHHIAQNFTGSSVSRLARPFVLHDIDTSIVQSDIEVYLRHELTRVAQEFELSTSHPWPSPSDFAELVKRAGALFLVASTGIKFIGDLRIREPKRQLRILLSDARASGPSPYKDLDQVYHQILRASVEGAESPDDYVCKRFRDVVGTIITLGNPLPPMTLHHLLVEEVEYIIAAVDLLRSVIITPSHPEPETEPYRVFHSSFPNYLIDRCLDARFAIHPVMQHTRLALHCLHLLNGFLRRNPCDLSNPLVLNSEVPDLEDRLKKTVLPHHQYVCRYWGFHLQAALRATKSLPKHHIQNNNTFDDIRSDLLATFSTFCREQLLHWIEVMSLLGLLAHTIPTLKSAEAWLKSIDSVHSLLPLLNDGQRLLLQYFEPIQLSASQIYYTALAFMPYSAMHTTYKSSSENCVQLVSRRESSWNPCIRVLVGHRSHVTSVAFSADGSHIVSGSWDNSVCIWDTATGSMTRKLEGHNNFVTSVAWSHDGSLVISGSWDNCAHIWDAATGKLLKVLKGHSGYISSVSFFQDGSHAISGSHDKTVGIWDLATGALKQLHGHTSNVTSVALFPNKSYAVSGSDDHTVRIWDLKEGSLMKKLLGTVGPIQSVAVSWSGRYIAASSSPPNIILLWDATNGTLVKRLKGHTSVIHSVGFSYDDEYIVSGSQDKTMRIWSVCDGRILRILEGPTDDISSAVFSFDGSQIVSGSYDRAISIWDTKTQPIGGHTQAHSDSIECVAFSNDRMTIATGSRDRAVRLWSGLTGNLMKKLGDHADSVQSVAFSHNGLLVASGSQDRTVHIWEIGTGTTKFTLSGHMDSVQCVAFSHDGNYIASGSHDKTIRIWDATSGSLMKILEGHQYPITSVVFSPDGSYILTSDILGIYLSWDTSTFAQTGRKASLLDVADQPVAIEGQWAVTKSGAHCELRRLCYLPVPSSSISAYLTSDRYLIIGTKSGVLYILDFSKTVQLSC